MKNLLTSILILVCLSAKAGDAADTTKYWKISGKSSLNFSQVSLTNWSEGGDMDRFQGHFCSVLRRIIKKISTIGTTVLIWSME